MLLKKLTIFNNRIFMAKKRKYYQGRFIPSNPQKYKGDVNKIFFRSSWELSFARYVDRNPTILEWSSESIAIPYVKPTTKRYHRYFPDFWIKYKHKDGSIHEEIIEIKPKEEWVAAMVVVESNGKVMPPDRSKNPKTRMYNRVTMMINAAKWRYAIKWCKERNMEFRIVDQADLFK